MTGNHARDDWADARTDEALRRELDALAGLGAASSALGDAPDGALGAVRGRVRRRRAAKQAGIGATTLAVAGMLALGGAALLPDPPTPLPGPAVTPSPTPEPEESGTGEGTGEGTEQDDAAPDDAPDHAQGPSAVDLIDDGYQPGWLEGTELVCGMAVDELPAGPAGWSLGATGPVGAAGPATSPVLTVATRLAVPGDVPADALAIGPTLVWAQDGVVVDVGINMTESPVELGPHAGGALDGLASDYPNTTCAPGGRAEGQTSFDTDLPPGRYEVRALSRLWPEDVAAGDLVLSAPFTVTVAGDGSWEGRAGG
ncbi:hypothetical protein ABE437_16525 [Isoptericola cucumis]|uniref:hypothetical protein n=1 Tax=Isoptericola cucumis TaxID=1776856 RepID=UPI00320B0B20